MELPNRSHAVSCSDGEIRIGNVYYSTFGHETPRTGPLEACVNGSWWSICSLFWDSKDASVACRQLGHSQYGLLEINCDYSFAINL